MHSINPFEKLELKQIYRKDYHIFSPRYSQFDSYSYFLTRINELNSNPHPASSINSPNDHP